MSDNYDPLTTQTAAITFRRLDALQDSIAAFGKTGSGAPVAILVAADGTLQTRRLNRLTDEVILVGTDAAATARPVLVDAQGRVDLRPFSALPITDFDSLRAYFLGPASAQVQGKADADGTLNVNDPTARLTLGTILAQLDLTHSALRDALTAPAPNARTLADLYAHLGAILAQLNLTTTGLRDAIAGAAPSTKTLYALDQDLVAALQATQPRSVTNFPADYPDALAQARLLSILGQLDAKTSEVRDGIAGIGATSKTLYALDQDVVAALQATQPRSITNFPSDYPDAVAQARLLTILGQLNITLADHRDALTAALAADQARHITNFPADYPDATAQARLQSLLTQLDRTMSEVFDVKTAQGAVTAAANNAGLAVTLDLGSTGRPTVQRFISVGGASTVVVQASRDGATWRNVETQTFAVASTSMAAVQGFGYRFIRVTSATTGVALEFEVSASR